MATAPVTLVNFNPGSLTSPFTTASISPVAGTYLIVVGVVADNIAIVNKPTISDSGGTIVWTELDNKHISSFSNPDLWLVAWISDLIPSSPPSITVTITNAGANAVAAGIVSVLAADTNGTMAQSASGEVTSGGTPSFTFGSTPNAAAICLCMSWMSGGNAVTKPATYTNLFDNTPTNVASRRASLSYDLASAIAGPVTVTSGNQRAVVLGIELALAGGGPTNTPQALNTTVTTTASMSKAIGKGLAVTVGTTVTALKSIAHKMLNTVTTTASQIKKTTKNTFANTVTTTASLTAMRVFLKALSVTVTTTSSMKRGVGKVASVTVNTTASLVRSTAKKLSATVTTSALLTRLFPRSLNVTVTTSTSMVRSVGKKLNVTVTSTASILKAISKKLTANVVTTNILSALLPHLNFVVNLLVTVTTTSTMKRATSKGLNTVVNTTSNLTKQIGKYLDVFVTTSARLVSSSHLLTFIFGDRIIRARALLRTILGLEAERVIHTVQETRSIRTHQEVRLIHARGQDDD